MTEDLVQAAKAAAELEPAVEVFAEATGALGPVREIAAWATDLIRYRRLPHQAKLLEKAAEKIEASRLPTAAVEDKLLRAILEDGPMEDDGDMQERWTNLLANAATTGHDRVVKSAFPAILSELDPEDVAVLNGLADRIEKVASNTGKSAALVSGSFRFSLEEWREAGASGRFAATDNLARLGLIRMFYNVETTLGGGSETSELAGALFTDFGWDFVQACRPPAPA